MHRTYVGPSMVLQSRLSASSPRVLIVGGEDVDARIELMEALSDEFTLSAAGTSQLIGRRFAAKGFQYYHYALGRGPNPLRDARALVSLWRVLHEYKPHIVHAFDTKPCVYGRLLAWLARVPVVVGTVPGLGSLYVDTGAAKTGLKRRFVKGIYERLQSLASGAANLTIFQNQDSAREFVSRGIVGRDKATIIAGSGVRTETFDPARISDADRAQVRKELGVPEDALVVTMVSRVIRSKGVEEFVAAARQVREHVPCSHFLLVGAADERSIDRFSAEQMTQIKQAVNWPGARRDIPRVLAATDVFVLPSFYPEGIPRVLLEAASMALPIITTRSPGCVDVVEDGVNGYLVPVRDGSAVAAALLRLVDNREARVRFGQESRRRAIALFDLSRVVGRTREIYRALLNGSAIPGVEASLSSQVTTSPSLG